MFLRRAHGPFALFKARFEKTQDEIGSACGKRLTTGRQWSGSVLRVSRACRDGWPTMYAWVRKQRLFSQLAWGFLFLGPWLVQFVNMWRIEVMTWIACRELICVAVMLSASYPSWGLFWASSKDSGKTQLKRPSLKHKNTSVVLLRLKQKQMFCTHQDRISKIH